jgi:hypothetical protein
MTPSADPPKKEIPLIEQKLRKNKPAIVGIITSVDATMIHVEENHHKHYGSYKGDFYLKKETEYWIRDGKTYRRGKKEDLYRGMKVEVWVEGLIAESVPFQSGDKYIVAGAKYIVYDAKELVDDQQNRGEKKISK